MKRFARTIGELFLLGLLAGILLVAVIAASLLIDDEKVQYFVIGYYVAIHNSVAIWIWRRLGIEKKDVAE